MDIQSEQRGGTLVISLAGSLDTLTAGRAQSTVGAQFDGGQHQIVLDLGDQSLMAHEIFTDENLIGVSVRLFQSYLNALHILVHTLF